LEPGHQGQSSNRGGRRRGKNHVPRAEHKKPEWQGRFEDRFLENPGWKQYWSCRERCAMQRNHTRTGRTSHVSLIRRKQHNERFCRSESGFKSDELRFKNPVGGLDKRKRQEPSNTGQKSTEADGLKTRGFRGRLSIAGGARIREETQLG